MEGKKKIASLTKMASNKANAKEEKLAELAGKIDETDEMKLKMLAALGTPDPSDILYPPELNAHLIEQLKVMTCENNELRKLLFTRGEEMKEMNKTVSDLNQRIRDIISGSGPTISSKSAGIISAKITELCRQNRSLVASVEGYKTRNAALERKVMQLETLNKEHEDLNICICNEQEYVEISPDEFKELNHKLAVVNKKLGESKNKNLKLKNEILVATKVLQQELGSKFTSIKDLQNELAGWKGRAEQIVLLQAKVSELEDKLRGNSKENEAYDPKKKNQTQLLRELREKNYKEMDQALKDAEIIRKENADIKKKSDALRCRIRSLECEITTVRQKMQTLVEKSTHDDMLVNEQRNQIKNIEKYYQEALKENTSKMNKMHAEIAEYIKLNKNTDTKIDALSKQASEKAAKIDELRAQLLRYEECSLQSVFFTPMKTATDNEIKNLTELVLTLNERLDNERHKWENLDTSHRKIKERKRRLERKVAVLEEEARILKEDTKRGSRVSKSSLPKDTYEIGIGFSLGTTKKKSTAAVVAEKPSESTSTESQPEVSETLDKDELKYKLELTEEKLKILEDKLKMIEEEKQEDYHLLTEMIQTSKQLFNEALAVLQKQKCLCF